MTRAVRVCLVALVLVNLAFVYITEAARWTWLGPLIALALASPWLSRLAGSWIYRLCWNLAVLGVFALLVQHVSYAGVAHLLEDGLLLAALCQVHLINMLGPNQKPDLVFFNSFLIAVVTSYLSLELGYSLVFLAYAPVLVISMQLLTLARTGAEIRPGLFRLAVRQGLVRGALVLGLTAIAFFFWPRDFHRRGFLALRLSPPDGLREVAFSEKIDLGQTGKATASDRIVMRVRLTSGTPADVPTHWRGATLDRFVGTSWRGAGNAYAADYWRLTGPRVWERRGRGRFATADIEVQLADPEAPRLFAPLASHRLELQTQSVWMRVNPMADLNFKCVRRNDRRPIRYALEVDGRRPDPGGQTRPLTRRFLTHVQQDPTLVPQRAREIARELRRQLPDDAEQHAIVEEMRRYLTARYRYFAPGSEGGARNLDHFLSGDAGGHCEYFATALVLMLRTEFIPCRVVTGYRSEEWDGEGEFLTVRARHAHAWVEVLDPQAGWYTVDPTPTIGAGATAAGTGVVARLKNFVSALWAEVTGFNEEARVRVLVWFTELPARLVERRGTVALATVLIVLAGFALRHRRLRRRPPAVRDYRRWLRRLRLRLGPGETPRELLARTALPPPDRERLRAATEAHEARRYQVA
ncbi:MAG: transglutaminase family protein [Planctomycetota bacterium]